MALYLLCSDAENIKRKNCVLKMSIIFNAEKLQPGKICVKNEYSKLKTRHKQSCIEQSIAKISSNLHFTVISNAENVKAEIFCVGNEYIIFDAEKL